MQNKDWTHEFIHKLFSYDIGTQGIQLRDEKLQHINLPLYKYCYVCDESSRSEQTVDYNIDNFEKDILFFQNPDKFNDPFDCYLGFSQSQIIRDLLLQELRKKKQYTPQNRKAINMLFNDNEESPNWDSIKSSDLIPITEAFMSLIPDDDPLKSVYSEFLQSLCSQDNEMIKKLVTNSLTIRDKQGFVDIMYDNPEFQKHLAKSCKPENLDFILKAAPRDMKINIENDPDSFMSENNGETFGIFDFLKIFSGMLTNTEFSADELDKIKLSFNDVSNTALEKSRKLISEQFRVTCLSERMDSSLMWSHYANKHYGFCLEYDFTLTITERRYPDLLGAQLMLFPVSYSQKRPLLSKALFSGSVAMQYIKNKKLPPDFLEKLMYGLLCKSEDWAYEKEWRIFQFPSGKPTMRLPKARKVFLGANMEGNAKKRIVEIANKKHIPVFQMFLRSDKYQFDFFQVK